MALFDFLKKKKKEEKERGKEGKQNNAKKAAEQSDKQKESSEIKTPEPKGVFREDFVLIAPHITERSRDIAEKHNAYVFKVLKSSNKKKVAECIEDLYKVKVKKVRMIRVPERPRRRGLTEGIKKGYKKAVITLYKGEKIELF
ncbi:50S ribosomal protein L23 [Patescibacteria group bacterium]